MRRARRTIVVTASLRPLLAEFLERTAPGHAVYAYSELPPELALVAVVEAPVLEQSYGTMTAASRVPA